MTARLLVLTPRFPYPLYSGDLVRIYWLCKTLSQKFRITLASICQNSTEMQVELPSDSPFSEVHRVYLPKWHSYANVVKAIVSGDSMQIAYYGSREFQTKVTQLAANHDTMLCHLARTAKYAIDFDGVKMLELTDYMPLTYSRSNAIKGKGASLRRLIYMLEKNRIDRAQNQLALKFNLVSFVSDIDREMFLKSSGMEPDRVVTFSFGVNIENRPFTRLRLGKTIGFIGTLKAMPNSDALSYFIEKIFPLIHKSDPEVRLLVVGAVNDKFRKKFECGHVEFVGTVPDLARALETCVIGICPVRIGAGIQTKMLDYMALGMPAVTTKIGAEGLEGKDGETFIVANEPEQFADSVLTLLGDEALRDQLAMRARKLMETHYCWSGRLAELPVRLLAAGKK